MKIEINAIDHNDDYIINIKTVKIITNDALSHIYLDPLILTNPDEFIRNLRPDISENLAKEFVDLMRNPESLNVLLWALTIAPYRYQAQGDIFANKQRDYIWEEFIECGLVETRFNPI